MHVQLVIQVGQINGRAEARKQVGNNCHLLEEEIL
jgi:hypothetical protein